MLPGHRRFSSTQLALRVFINKTKQKTNMKCDVAATKGLVKLEK